MTTKNLIIELNKISNTDGRAKLLKEYAQLKQNLGGEGASKKTAALIINSLMK